MYIEWGLVDQWKPSTVTFVGLLGEIGDAIYAHHGINPMKNPGEFHCRSFSVVGYWRGDNDLSKETMEVERINFRWGSFMARWVGFVSDDSVSMSRAIDINELYTMSIECLEGVRHRRARIIP